MSLRTLIYLALAAVAGFFYYTRYYLWIDCFNELGRCYDPDGSGEVYTDAGRIWAYVLALFLMLAAWRAFRRVAFGRRPP